MSIWHPLVTILDQLFVPELSIINYIIHNKTFTNFKFIKAKFWAISSVIQQVLLWFASLVNVYSKYLVLLISIVRFVHYCQAVYQKNITPYKIKISSIKFEYSSKNCVDLSQFCKAKSFLILSKLFRRNRKPNIAFIWQFSVDIRQLRFWQWEIANLPL